MGRCETTSLGPQVGPGAGYGSSRINLRRAWSAGAGVLPREAEVVSAVAVAVAECGEPRRLLAAVFVEVVAEALQPRQAFAVLRAGMSRPLLEFGGGSGEILRDLLHLRSVSDA